MSQGVTTMSPRVTTVSLSVTIIFPIMTDMSQKITTMLPESANKRHESVNLTFGS